MLCSGMLVSPVHDKGFVEGLASRIDGFLGEDVRRLGFLDEDPVLPGDCEGFLFFVLTGGTESLMLSARRAGLGRPSVFLSHSKANSLAALLEASPIIMGVSGTLTGYIGDLSSGDAASLIETYKRVLNGVLRLRRSMLGVLGGPSPWLVYSRSTSECVLRRVGVKLKEIGLDVVYREFESIKPDEVDVRIEPSDIRVPDKEVGKALRLYVALKRIIASHGLDALTIKCFDIIDRLGTTACLPLSLLNSEGIVAGCEGDVPATIAMMMAYYVTGKPAFMANPSEFDDNTILFAHCTAPLSMAEEGYELKTHFETGKGVGVAAKMKEGSKVTVLRLTPGMDALRVFKGVVVEGAPRSPFHCRTQIRVKVDFDPNVLLTESMGNHHVLVLGDHVKSLLDAGRLLGLRLKSL